jgi:hypothetical protein
MHLDQSKDELFGPEICPKIPKENNAIHLTMHHETAKAKPNTQ